MIFDNGTMYEEKFILLGLLIYVCIAIGMEIASPLSSSLPFSFPPCLVSNHLIGRTKHGEFGEIVQGMKNLML